MTQEQLNKGSYDVVSLSQSGKSKRKNHVRNALIFNNSDLVTSGKFVKVMANIFKTKGAQTRAVC